MTYAITVGGKPSQVTVVVIEPKSGEGVWTIIAGGSGEVADLADKTARNFVFK